MDLGIQMAFYGLVMKLAPGTIAYAIEAYQREMDRDRAEKARKELQRLNSESTEAD